jgi:urease accessory protein
MRRAIAHHGKGHWPPQEPVATVTLAFDDRFRRRIRLDDDDGEPFLLDLPDAVMLGDGDALSLDCGGLIEVRAAPEPVADIRTGSPQLKSRIAWHLGNRHTPVQVLGSGDLRIRDDHVLVEMAEKLGASVHRHDATFTPEPGAYAGEHQGQHGHGHHHGHDH